MPGGKYLLSAPRPAAKQHTIQIDQFQIIPNRYYTNGHIWVKPLKATKVMKEHSEKLHQRLNKELDITMTDGAGNLVSNIPSLIKDAEWDNITGEFFKP